MFAVLLLTLSVLPMIGVFAPEAGGYSGESHKVVYHLNGINEGNIWSVEPTNREERIQVDTDHNSVPPYDTDLTVEVEYYGSEFSTEYNPQFWKDTFSQGNENWFEIKDYVPRETIVFTGWKYGESAVETHYPGEIVTSEMIDSLTSSEEDTIHIYATWGVLDNYLTALRDATFNGGNVYTNVIQITRNDGASISSAHGDFTLRGQNLYIWGADTLNGNVIIDGISIQNMNVEATNSNHGDGNRYGIFANGHTLIIGTGVDVTYGVRNTYNSWTAPQIYGGSNFGSCGSTNVIIHSGTFYNVVAGGYECTINGNTNLVVRGGTILDTIIGGNAGGSNSSSNVITGDTNVHITGNAIMPGDEYEERQLDSNYNSGFRLTESTILTGGSNNGTVNGNTNVYISGDAQLWDVQGGGRRGSSVVGLYNGGSTHGSLVSGGTAHVYVSGNAVIKHVLCGSITDGINSGNGNQCVKNVMLYITDSAAVASVFGAGYDTWYDPGYSSMYGGGEISIAINGDATVGYVYGGGYRGTVGLGPQYIDDTEYTQPLESIAISISGNVTILEDVFGGGRGGLDKITHNVDGTFNNGSGYVDSTGQSAVYVEHIDIKLSGNAIVKGNVYGGGESTPIITGLSSMSRENSPEGVAKVECNDISVSLNGNSVVVGDVYGAGKGIDTNDVIDGIHSSAFIFSIKESGDSWEITRIPWITNVGSDGNSVLITDAYFDYNNSEYASVDSSTVNVNISSNVEGSVYGAGAHGKAVVSQNLYVSISGTVDGNVHGGALGSSNGSEINTEPLVFGTRYVAVYGDANIGGSVYGGSRNASATGDNHVLLISGTVKGNAFGGPFMGSLKDNTHVYVGDYAYDFALERGIISDGSYESFCGVGMTVGIGIYGGGDVGDPSNGNLSGTVTVQGDTEVLIGKDVLVDGEVDYGSNGYGSAGYQSIPVSAGTIAGAGNAGTIGGESTVTISGINIGADESLYSIQRSDNLILICADVTFQGEYDGAVSGPSERWSISSIKKMKMTDSTIHLESQAGSIETLEIADTSGVRSRLCLHNGSVLYIHSDTAAGDITGGSAFLRVEDGDTYYGAYVVYHEGTLKGENNYIIKLGEAYYLSSDTEVDNSDQQVQPEQASSSLGLTNNGTFYWRAGPQMNLWISESDLTISENNDEESDTIIVSVAQVTGTVAVDSIVKLSSSDGLYSGSDSVQVPVTAGNKIAFLEASLAPNNAGSGMDLVNENMSGSQLSGTISLDEGWGEGSAILNLGTSNTVYSNKIGTGGIIDVGVYLQSEATGLPRGTVATLTIHLMETTEMEVEIEVGEDQFKKQTINTPVKYIDIRVEVVIVKDEQTQQNESVEIDLADDKGSTKMVLPALQGGARDVYIENFTMPGWIDSITISTSRNFNGSYGWAGGINSVTISTHLTERLYLGEYTGVRDVAVDISVTVNEKYNPEDATFEISMGSQLRGVTVSVTVIKPENVTVRLFVPEYENGKISHYTIYDDLSLEYGSTLNLQDYKIDGLQFLGWRVADDVRNDGLNYTLRDTLVPFDYSQRVVSDTDLVATFSYSVVTFDPQGGVVDYTQLSDLASGTVITLPNCERSGGFIFVGWRVTIGEETSTYEKGASFVVSSGVINFIAIWNVELEGWTGSIEENVEVLISEKDWKDNNYSFTADLLPDRVNFGKENLKASIVQTDGELAAWILYWPEDFVSMYLDADGQCTLSFENGPGTGHFRVSVSVMYVATSENHSNTVFSTMEWVFDVYVIPDQI